MKLLAISLLQALFPVIGAQVFIEPGQSVEKTDGWFRTLEECGMTSCRIRLFEAYDPELFDRALDCAQKHNIGVWLTFFPETEKTDIGGWKFPYDDAQKASFADFIRRAVTRWKDHPALKGWVLINEPGIGEIPDTPFARAARQKWDQEHPVPEYSAKGNPVLMTPADSRFIMDFNTDFLRWIAGEVRALDPVHDLHVNPHAVYYNFTQYDFPAYREFLTSLGGSAHPSWHFGYFNRDEYTLAMLAQSEIIRSGAGPMPWFMTEIQGGNNTFSGAHAICPTPTEITKWLWTVIGCEGKGGIFWMLNPRSSGIEAGEWGMIDYNDKPTERLLAAGKVAAVLRDRRSVLQSLRECPSGIDIVYTRESVWAEKLLSMEGDRYEGRRPGAVAKSVAACFRALTERGLNVGIKALEEYDFSQPDFGGKTIVLTHQISISEAEREKLRGFVENGGTIIVEGLTGYYDDNLVCTLFGGDLSEYIIDDNGIWRGRFADGSDFKTKAVGRGKLVWYPTSIGIEAWSSRDFRKLSAFLWKHSTFDRSSVRFRGYRRGMILRTLDSPEGKVIISIKDGSRHFFPRLKGIKGRKEVIFKDQNVKVTLYRNA